MGVLIEGVWRDEELPQEVGRAGEFRRGDSRFRDRITADGSSGFKAEAGRYHLYVAHGCPWAHRTLISRAIKKFDGLISVAYAIPGLKQKGWTFEDDPRYPDCIPDKVNGFHYLYEAYLASKSRRCGTRRRRRSSTTNHPRSSGCSTQNSTPSPATAPSSIRGICAPRSTRLTNASTTTSTTRMPCGLRKITGRLRGGL